VSETTTRQRITEAHEWCLNATVDEIERTREDAKLGAALRAALATTPLYGWLAIQRLPDEKAHRNVILIPNRPEPHCDENEGTLALAALLRPSPPEGPQE
jgi:hypothetical protein